MPWSEPLWCVRRMPIAFVATLAAAAAGLVTIASDGQVAVTPEARALAYLAREVPRWSRQNHCFSCHNNGDAARALYQAVQAGDVLPREALDDTTRWLIHPERWDHNGGDGPFSDKGLARIQFAAALITAKEAKLGVDDAAWARAGALVAGDQRPDGSWQVDAIGQVGSPVTYGSALATVMACRTLRACGDKRHRDAIDRAHQWLLSLRPDNLVDASAILMGLARDASPAASDQRRGCLNLIERSQARDGGWGPFRTAPPEVFDTAIVLLALGCVEPSPAIESRRQRGRAYLIRQQQPDGSWPETTRPSGAESYAQRLSTTGWATQALLSMRAPLARR